jgi:hypothetical protein
VKRKTRDWWIGKQPVLVFPSPAWRWGAEELIGDWKYAEPVEQVEPPRGLVYAHRVDACPPDHVCPEYVLDLAIDLFGARRYHELGLLHRYWVSEDRLRWA